MKVYLDKDEGIVTIENANGSLTKYTTSDKGNLCHLIFNKTIGGDQKWYDEDGNLIRELTYDNYDYYYRVDESLIKYRTPNNTWIHLYENGERSAELCENGVQYYYDKNGALIMHVDECGNIFKYNEDGDVIYEQMVDMGDAISTFRYTISGQLDLK